MVFVKLLHRYSVTGVMHENIVLKLEVFKFMTSLQTIALQIKESHKKTVDSICNSVKISVKNHEQSKNTF